MQPPAESKPMTYTVTSRWRAIGTTVLLITFCLSAALAIPSVWARNQVVDTDRYVRTVKPLASDERIQNAIATKISNVITNRIGTERITGEALSPTQQALRAPLVSTLNSYIYDTVLEVLQSDQFQQFWVDANTKAHALASKILAGKDTGAVQLNNGELTLDLQPLIAQVQQRLVDRGLDAAGRIQLDNVDTTFVIFDSPQLAKAQSVVKTIQRLAIVLPIVALLALVGYIILARDRRRALIMASLGLTVAMILLLIAVAVLRWKYLDSLSPDRDKDAATAFFDTLLRYLRNSLRVIALIGLAIAGIVYITQPQSRVARAGQSAGSWLETNWRQASTKWPWLNSAVDGVARYRRVLYVSLFAICCLILIIADRITLGIAIFTAIVGWIGYLLISSISRLAARRRAAAEAAPIATESAQPVVPAAAAEPTVVQTPVAAAPTPSPARSTTVTLSEEDAKMLSRLASLLREAPSESGA
jgi:hypothetical protein